VRSGLKKLPDIVEKSRCDAGNLHFMFRKYAHQDKGAKGIRAYAQLLMAFVIDYFIKVSFSSLLFQYYSFTALDILSAWDEPTHNMEDISCPTVSVIIPIASTTVPATPWIGPLTRSFTRASVTRWGTSASARTPSTAPSGTTSTRTTSPSAAATTTAATTRRAQALL
jgi:hypothetical protein